MKGSWTLIPKSGEVELKVRLGVEVEVEVEVVVGAGAGAAGAAESSGVVTGAAIVVVVEVEIPAEDVVVAELVEVETGEVEATGEEGVDIVDNNSFGGSYRKKIWI